MSQKTLTVKGVKFTAVQIRKMIVNSEVTLNNNHFHVTYRKKDDTMHSPNRTPTEADYFLLWGNGYKYAFQFDIIGGAQNK